GLLVYANDQFYEEGFFPKKLIGRSGRTSHFIISNIKSII
ncbi:unnamed protein product, partial [marine sediment metagenome]